MEENNYEEYSYSLIEGIFGDYRKIDGKASDEIQNIARMHNIPAEIYQTENGEFISFNLIDEDFGNSDIEKYGKYGEDLYEKSGKEVCIYVLGSPHIKINITKELKSDAVMLINVSKFKYSSTYETLRHIEGLVKSRQKLDQDDLFALKMIPIMGPPEDKRNLRIECLKLWKTIVKKGLIK